MRKLLEHILLCTLLCSMAIVGTHAQTAKVSETQWQQLTNDKAFSYKDKKESYAKPHVHERSPFEKAFSRAFDFFAGHTGRMIGWVIFFVLLGWAFYMILFNSRTSLIGKRSKQIETEPEAGHADNMETNWETLLQQAIDARDMRMVIRYSYMRLLQLLQDNELIHFRSDKTNYDYYNELTDAQLKKPFRQLSRQYEYAWYGNFAVSDETYRSYMDTFTTLKNRLDN